MKAAEAGEQVTNGKGPKRLKRNRSRMVESCELIYIYMIDPLASPLGHILVGEWSSPQLHCDILHAASCSP